MTTISGLNPGSPPLTGNEVLPTDITVGGLTYRFTTGDVAKLAELYAALNGAVPERIDAAAVHFTTQGAGAALTTWFAPTVTTKAAYGPVVQATGGLQLFSRWPHSAGPGKILEVVAEVEQVTVAGGESPVTRVGLHSLKNDLTDTSLTPDAVGAASAVLTAGQVVTLRQRFGVSADLANSVLAWADAGSAAWFRPFVDVNLKSDLTGHVASSVAYVRRLVVRDVTSVALSDLARRSRRRFFDRILRS